MSYRKKKKERKYHARIQVWEEKWVTALQYGSFYSTCRVSYAEQVLRVWVMGRKWVSELMTRICTFNRQVHKRENRREGKFSRTTGGWKRDVTEKERKKKRMKRESEARRRNERKRVEDDPLESAGAQCRAQRLGPGQDSLTCRPCPGATQSRTPPFIRATLWR